jgi:hypothetical protein
MERENKRLAYQGKIEALLKEWGSQIDQLLDQGSEGVEDFIAEVNTKRQAVRSQLGDMKMMGEESWFTLQDSLDQAVADMHRVMDDARERFSTSSS